MEVGCEEDDGMMVYVDSGGDGVDSANPNTNSNDKVYSSSSMANPSHNTNYM